MSSFGQNRKELESRDDASNFGGAEYNEFLMIRHGRYAHHFWAHEPNESRLLPKMSVSNNHVSTKKFRKITLDMVLASTSLTRSSKETADAYLQRVTHLHLQNKKIRVIESLDQCTNLKV